MCLQQAVVSSWESRTHLKTQQTQGLTQVRAPHFPNMEATEGGLSSPSALSLYQGSNHRIMTCGPHRAVFRGALDPHTSLGDSFNPYLPVTTRLTTVTPSTGSLRQWTLDSGLGVARSTGQILMVSSPPYLGNWPPSRVDNRGIDYRQSFSHMAMNNTHKRLRIYFISYTLYHSLYDSYDNATAI